VFDWIARFFRRRRGVHVEIASFSECGPVRPENQDHILVNRRGLVFCVADGMGGGEGGAIASDIVCRGICAAAKRRTDFPERVRRVDEALRDADSEVRAYAAKAGFRHMGCTATILVVDAEEGRSAAVGNIGDSRVYRFRAGDLRQLTEDHTVAREMLRRNVSRSLQYFPSPRTAMLSHVLTRAVGVGEESKLDWRNVDTLEGDVFLLCSDGVHGAIEPADLKDAFTKGGGAGEIAERIRLRVLASGARDNLSAIVVKIGGRA